MSAKLGERPVLHILLFCVKHLQTKSNVFLELHNTVIKSVIPLGKIKLKTSVWGVRHNSQFSNLGDQLVNRLQYITVITYTLRASFNCLWS